MKDKFEVEINHKKKHRLIIKLNGKCNYENLKKELQNKTKVGFIRRKRIYWECVLFELNGKRLDNDEEIECDCKLDIYLNVKWKESSETENCREERMEYDDRKEDLIRCLSKIMPVSNINLLSGKKFSENKYLREYLRKTNEIFIVVPGKWTFIVKNNIDGVSDENGTCISIEHGSTVEYLRRVIVEKLKISVCNFDVYHENNRLDSGSLASFNLKNNDTLLLKSVKRPTKQGEQFIISVKNDGNQNYMIDDFETVGALKSILREQYNVKVDSMQLVFGGEELRNEEIIRDKVMESGASVELRFVENASDKVPEIRIVVVNGLGSQCGVDREHLTVSGTDTVGSVRNRIDELLHLSKVEYVVSYCGEIMKKENAIDTYNIGDGDQVLVSASVLVRYFMAGNNNSAKVNRYAFAARDTVTQLKAKITKKLNLEARFINLSHNGVVLEDDAVLEDAGVENESYLMMISTLAGGR